MIPSENVYMVTAGTYIKKGTAIKLFKRNTIAFPAKKNESVDGYAVMDAAKGLTLMFVTYGDAWNDFIARI